MNPSPYHAPSLVRECVIVHTNGIPGLIKMGATDTADQWVKDLQIPPSVSCIETAKVESPSFRTGNAMAVNTGVKAFDSMPRCYIDVGNVIADTMRGTFVRPRKEVKCNGTAFREGELQKTDLAYFGQQAEAMCSFIRSEPAFDTEKCLAYLIFHHAKNKRVVHGALVTDVSRRLVRSFSRRDLGLPASAASKLILDKASYYLTDACVSDRKTVWTRH
jgi:hypothetical protein